MANTIPLKLLFQQQGEGPETKFRLSIAIDAESIRKMLKDLEANADKPVSVCAEMPSEHMGVHVEIYENGYPKSDLDYLKHLTERGWHTNHVSLF
jgi:hypothetical protein